MSCLPFVRVHAYWAYWPGRDSDLGSRLGMGLGFGVKVETLDQVGCQAVARVCDGDASGVTVTLRV